MRLRTQLAIAFFLLAVLPLLGVTLYTWLGSERAFRQAVAAEAGDLAAEMSTRVDVVADELKARLTRMRGRSGAGQESPYQKARREALAAAEGEELRLLLRAILSGAERRQGAIPFARDPDGKVYAPDPADEAVLEGLGQVPGKPVTRRDAGEWVVAERRDPETGIVIAVARPVGPALQEMRRTAANNLALGLGLALLALLGILPLSHRMTRHIASLTDGARRLAAGDLDVRVPVPHGREFRQLAETFNLLARDLRRNQERLLEQERLRKELEIGRRIQEELLPRGPLPRAVRRGGRHLHPGARGGRRLLQLLPAPRGRGRDPRGRRVRQGRGGGAPDGQPPGDDPRAPRRRARPRAARGRPRPRDGQRRAARALLHPVPRAAGGAHRPAALRQRRAQHAVRAAAGRARRAALLDRAPAGPLPGRRLRGAHGRDAGRGRPLPVHRRPRRDRGRDRRALRHVPPRGAAQGPPRERPRRRSSPTWTRRCGLTGGRARPPTTRRWSPCASRAGR